MIIFQILLALAIVILFVSIIVLAAIAIWAALQEEQKDINKP
jgi:uncharacterized membrane protein (DUF4010 family)